MTSIQKLRFRFSCPFRRRYQLDVFLYSLCLGCSCSAAGNGPYTTNFSTQIDDEDGTIFISVLLELKLTTCPPVIPHSEKVQQLDVYL